MAGSLYVVGTPIGNLEDMSDELLDDPQFARADSLAKEILIIGGGVIGMEFASVFASLGCKVTIVEAMERILPTMDREISQSLNMLLKKRGDSHKGLDGQAVSVDDDLMDGGWVHNGRL